MIVGAKGVEKKRTQWGTSDVSDFSALGVAAKILQKAQGSLILLYNSQGILPKQTHT